MPAGLTWLILASAVTIAWVVSLHRADSMALGFACMAAAAIAVVVFLAQRRAVNGRFVLEPPVLVVLVLFAWHFAFWPVYFLGLASTYRVRRYLDFAPEYTVSALVVCLIAVLACIAGTQAGLGSARTRPMRVPATLGTEVYIGAAAGTLMSLVYFALRGSSLVGQYADVFVEEDPLRRLYSLGLVLVLGATGPIIQAEENRARRRGFVILMLLPTLLVSLAIGSRWVLFSAALLVLAARSMRGRRRGLLGVVLIGLSLVLLGTLVRDFRDGAISGVDEIPSALVDRYQNPLIEFPEEIGLTFLPVAGTLQLADEDHDYLYGASFGASLLTIVPSGESLAGEDALPRLSSEFAAVYDPERYFSEGGTLGYSLVAELYRNFGIGGVLAGMALFGYALGRIYRHAVASDSLAWLFALWAVATFAMFGVRNDTFTWLRFAVWGGLIFMWIGRRAAAASAPEPAPERPAA